MIQALSQSDMFVMQFIKNM